MEYDKIDAAAPVPSPGGAAEESRGKARLSRRRWTGRLAMATALLAFIAMLALAHRQKRAAAEVNSVSRLFQPYVESNPGCLSMPARADQYNGITDERRVDIYDDKWGQASVFVIGDWGATFPNHLTFAGQGGDMYSQFAVANAFKARAKWADPQYVLNVGDNFYVGGLETPHNCQQPPGELRDDVIAKFQSVWVDIYAPVSSKPWLSVLGNHDYGGYRMDNGWPKQIGYSFMNHNWIMPARYYMKRMNHSTFVVDYFMIDSNVFDAKNPGQNPDHNICSFAHNSGGMGTCANNGGPTSVMDCQGWFMRSWGEQKKWLERKLSESDAHWKVVVTHFPCGYESGWYKSLKKWHKVDLLVTGHRHQQELWAPSTTSKYVQGFLKTNDWGVDAPACIVSGGGGGIVSQKFAYADYGKDLLWYGFFHLTISRDKMKIELVNTDGNVAGNYTIYPHGSAAQKDQDAALSKHQSEGGLCESYCGDNNNPWGMVCGWMSCSGCVQCKPQKGTAAVVRK
jgi:hypothetical protein